MRTLQRCLRSAAAIGAVLVVSPAFGATLISWSVLGGGAAGAAGASVEVRSTAGQSWAQRAAGPTILYRLTHPFPDRAATEEPSRP